MVNRPDNPSRYSPDHKTSMTERPILVESRFSASSVWSLLALSELTSEGPLRFPRLLERVEGVSQKSMIATLRGLERYGLVRRSITVQIPIRLDYEATVFQHELIVRFQRFLELVYGKGRGVQSCTTEL
jgi:DNA-binding HxlR family transcriptional regulator